MTESKKPDVADANPRKRTIQRSLDSVFVRSPSAPEVAQYKTKDKHDKQILTRYFVFVLKVCSFSVYIHNAVFCTACLYYIVIV